METPTFIESYDTQEYELCDKIIARLEELLSDNQIKASHHYMDGRESNGSAIDRVDDSVMFNQISDPLCIDIHNVMAKHLEQEYCKKYASFNGFPCISEHVKVQRTPPKGGFHTWHKEHGPDSRSAYRTLVWTLYLNDIPDGEGETEFLEYGIKVQPKKGKLCFFPAGWSHTHRGNPVYSCNKYIATGWYYLT